MASARAAGPPGKGPDGRISSSSTAHERTEARHYIDTMLEPLIGLRIAGGCDECLDPYQTVERLDGGAWVIHVHHDARCPVLTPTEAAR
jgi:hypothetical protein